MKAKFKGKIINAIRKLTWSWEPYSNVKKESKVDSACYCCSKCGKYCYDGKSDKNFKKLKEKYPKKELINDTIFIDHIDPVVPLKHWSWNWDDYINRLFCPKENLQALCRECHDEKTQKENNIRNKLKRELKNQEKE